MFAELVGNFDLNGVSCDSSFCGYRIEVTADTYLVNTEYYAGGVWEAYVSDPTSPNSPYTYVSDSGSNVGVTGSLPFAITSMEAQGASSSSYINTPIYFTSLTVDYPLGTQVNIDSTNMQSYLYPTAGSGISVSFSATGTSTASATIT
jgi:hypothetical protein